MSTVMTQIPDEKLVALADTYHTPLYVFEEAVIRSRCSEVNFGGGLPVVYDQATQKPMPLRDWGNALSESMVAFSKKMGREIILQIEPGRYIVAHSGTLLAEVQAVKSTPEYRFAIVNTGIQLDELASLSPGFFGRLGEDYRATWNVERYHATRTGDIQRRAIEKGPSLLLTHKRKNVLRYNMSHPLKALTI